MTTIYLLHFQEKIGNHSNPMAMAQHYIGSADDLDIRLSAHLHGSGAAIMAAVCQKYQYSFALARIWENEDREKEKILKSQKHASRFCPICKGEKEYQPYQPEPVLEIPF